MEDVESKLKSIVADVLDKDAVTCDGDFQRPLKELGIDSLDAMTLLLKVQDAFGLPDISDEDMARLNTLGGIAAYVRQNKERIAS